VYSLNSVDCMGKIHLSVWIHLFVCILRWCVYLSVWIIRYVFTYQCGLYGEYSLISVDYKVCIHLSVWIVW
jgi:hypothetical protein